MKNLIACILLCLIVTCFLACDRKNYIQEEGFCTAMPDKDTVVFEYNKPVSLFTSCGDNIPASVTNISDSRCPEGVNCVWAGKLTVGLQMSGLNITLEKDKAVDTFYLNNRYSFFLVNALPEPVAQNPATPEQKTVIINITRANRSKPVQPDNTLPVASDSMAKPKG